MSVLLTEATKFMNKAVRAREAFYQGLKEAGQDFRMGRGSYASVADAEYKATQSPTMKTLVADNHWHMNQSQMYSALATAKALEDLLAEQKETNRLLKNITHVLGEMKVF
jgi:hypothetical protein